MFHLNSDDAAGGHWIKGGLLHPPLKVVLLWNWQQVSLVQVTVVNTACN